MTDLSRVLRALVFVGECGLLKSRGFQLVADDYFDSVRFASGLSGPHPLRLVWRHVRICDHDTALSLVRHLERLA